MLGRGGRRAAGLLARLFVAASLWSGGEMGVNALSKEPAPGYEPETSLLSRYVTGLFNLRWQVPKAGRYLLNEAEKGYERATSEPPHSQAEQTEAAARYLPQNRPK